MKKIFLYTVCLCSFAIAKAQETISPAPPQKATIVLTNATIHVGNGQVINNGSVVITDGKIAQVGATVSTPGNAVVIDCKGKQVYPGLILSSSELGLVEVPAVRATLDNEELGEINPSIRSLMAYNADSKIINTLRTSGILLATTVPGGGLISGSSSVVQLDAWNWEDAAYKADNAIHFHMPSLLARTRGRGFGGGFGQQPPVDPIKRGLDQIETVKNIFQGSKSIFGRKQPR
ncbi:MAG: hypothetical protein WDM90_19585 [Ferruginibacter sp.]